MQMYIREMVLGVANSVKITLLENSVNKDVPAINEKRA